MDALLHDLRFALRAIRRAPGIYLLAVLSLGIGIGANTTVFSAIDVFLLRPLPFPDGDRIVQLAGTMPERGWSDMGVSVPDYRDFAERVTTLDLAATYDANYNVVGDGEPERLNGVVATASFFRVLGETPVAGRAFSDADASPAAPPVALISEGVWQRRYGRAADVLGRTINLDGTAHAIVGVVSSSLTYPGATTDVWTPLRPDGSEGRADRYLDITARLRDGVTIERARAEAVAIAQSLAAAYPENAGVSADVVSLRDDLYDETFRTASAIAMTSVVFVLLIACANVANLLLARAAAREREIAVRTVLGAGRWRVARQLLTESIVVALLSGALGALLSVWGIRGLLTLMPAWFPFVDRIGLDGRALAFTAIVCLGAGVLFGLAPTLHALRPDLNSVLRESGGRGATLGRRGGRFRGAMVIAEIGLALVLLVCAGLLLRGYDRLRSVDRGFATENIATLRVSLPEAQYADSATLINFYERLAESIAELPGVEHTSGASNLPIGGGGGTLYTIPGEAAVADDQRPVARFSAVLPGYFETMAIGVVRGRDITRDDKITGVPVVVVNEAFEQRHWPGSSAVGRHVQLTSGLREIVGVVMDTRDSGDSDAPPTLYLPMLQRPQRSVAIVASSDDVAGAHRVVREAMTSLDPRLPLYAVSTMKQTIEDSDQANVIMAKLLAIFAGIAVLMAVLGVYGVMSYTVAQRTQEVGIRMALGARSPDILSLIVRQGSLLALFGIGGGLLVALGVSRFLSAFLYGISPFDPLTFGSVAALLGLAAVAACWIPASRASRVDPLVALRTD